MSARANTSPTAPQRAADDKRATFRRAVTWIFDDRHLVPRVRQEAAMRAGKLRGAPTAFGGLL